MFAHVVDGEIKRVGDVPSAARRLDSGGWVLGLASAAARHREACGWLEVVDVDRPDDTDDVTYDRSVELVEGVPTVVWTGRPWTAAEVAAKSTRNNRQTIDAAIAAAVAELDAIVDADALPEVPAGTMSAAQLSNVVRAMRGAVQQNREGAQRVARTLKHTVRMVRGDFDGVD